jgi:DNA-binding MarR family transcriptional regulator
MADPTKAQAFERLALEVRRTFHELRAVAERLHGDAQGVTPSHRAVLESLRRSGPQTVPALARARPVARQHIQVLVNDLQRLGLVATLANPAHRRSPLVELTRRGRQRFDSLLRREREALSQAKLPLSAAQMTEVAEALQTLRAALAELAR